ncbi:nodulation protein NodH [Sedimentitalea sp. HM32M-2]
MPGPFDFFVLFAEMRTGSNFLESNLNAIDGVQCFGEAFNPHFIGYPNRSDILGVTRPQRDADPAALIAAVRAVPAALGGFRYFHDHDPRVLDQILHDPRCGKIVLTRNPLDSYVSWKIAKATGQWKLTDIKRRKETRITFLADEFVRHLEIQQAFRAALQNRLQITGQTAFHLAYEDLQDVAAINGLAQWLGVAGRLDGLDPSLKPQNPGPIAAKVTNPDEMAEALAGMEWFNLAHMPNFEPRRGPAVPGYVTAARAPLLYMPVPGGPDTEIADWLAALDGAAPSELGRGLNQKRLRHWKRRHPGHRSFTVLRHPAARAHAVFCQRVLSPSKGDGRLRQTLRRQFQLKLPKDGPGAGYDLTRHRAAFDRFLDFVQASLAGQVAMRPDAAWGTQAAALAGFADFAQPDFVLREGDLAAILPVLAALTGRDAAPPLARFAPDTPFDLAQIYDDTLEARIATVYQRDYMMFGFGPWRGD